jgi:hypothetical protein
METIVYGDHGAASRIPGDTPRLQDEDKDPPNLTELQNLCSEKHGSPPMPIIEASDEERRQTKPRLLDEIKDKHVSVCG